MARNFQVIQLDISPERFKALESRLRNQLIGCMHAHNDLSVLNRILMFSLNDVGEGDLHNEAHGIQMWCVMQILVGKIYETWNMLGERFLKSNPEDPVLVSLPSDIRPSLKWLKTYFGLPGKLNETPLRTIRDKSAFHYDKLNLSAAVDELSSEECRAYLAQHPANTVYYAGSALVFRTLFVNIADASRDTSGVPNIERMKIGTEIALADLNDANFHLNRVLYGIISQFLERISPAGEAQTRVQILDAPRPTTVGLPMFIDVGNDPAESASA